jgi:hypothetical protein
MNDEIKQKKVRIARTRNGIPCLWESLTNFSNLRRATAIFGKDRKPKKAVFINYEKEKQALVPIHVGDYISKAFEDQNGVALSIFRVESISSMDNSCTVVPVYRKSSLIQEYTVDDIYESMVSLTIDKLQDRLIISEKSAKLKKQDEHEEDFYYTGEF